MAKLGVTFDPSQYDPTQSAGALPIGRHKVVIKGSEVKNTKSQAGGYVEFSLEIIEGPNAGVTGPYRLNIFNQSQQTVDIAYRHLSALCYVTTGGQRMEDTQQLHNIPFMIEVAMQKGEEAAQKGYTEVKKVMDINGNEPTRNGAAPQQPQGQQAPQGQPQQQAPAQQQQPAAWGNQAPAQGQPMQQQPPQQAPGQWGGAQGQPAQQQAPQGQQWGQQAPQGQPQGQPPQWGQQQPAQGQQWGGQAPNQQPQQWGQQPQ